MDFTNDILKVFFLSSESVCSSCSLSSVSDECVFSSLCGSDGGSGVFSELSDFSGTAALTLSAGGSGCEEEAQQFTTNQQETWSHLSQSLPGVIHSMLVSIYQHYVNPQLIRESSDLTKAQATVSPVPSR